MTIIDIKTRKEIMKETEGGKFSFDEVIAMLEDAKKHNRPCLAIVDMGENSRCVIAASNAEVANFIDIIGKSAPMAMKMYLAYRTHEIMARLTGGVNV